MAECNIEGTKDTPKVYLSSEKKELTISGYSYPENSVEFYKPILETIDNVVSGLQDDETFSLNFELLYFNSSTSKILIDIFDKLEESANAGKKIVVNWRYNSENESMAEYGNDFKEGLEAVRFNIIEVEK